MPSFPLQAGRFLSGADGGDVINTERQRSAHPDQDIPPLKKPVRIGGDGVGSAPAPLRLKLRWESADLQHKGSRADAGHLQPHHELFSDPVFHAQRLRRPGPSPVPVLQSGPGPAAAHRVLLFANELLGSSGLFPFLLLQILADVHRVSAPLCFLQVFVLYLYGSVEFFILAAMSYDRYVAICRPLQYHSLMTPQKVAVLVALTWALPFLTITALVGMSAPLPLCGSVIDKVYCGNYAIVKLSCADTRLHNIYGLSYTVLSVVLPALSILYSYARILQVCCSGSRQTRQKALSTCTPHLASVLNFSFGCCFQVLQSRFETRRGSDPLQVFLSLYFLTCQPLFTPLLYGLKMAKIQDACQQLLCGGRAAAPPQLQA